MYTCTQFYVYMYVQQKVPFKNPVFKDHLGFMNEIPCVNNFVQKSPCIEPLPVKCDL